MEKILIGIVSFGTLCAMLVWGYSTVLKWEKIKYHTKIHDLFLKVFELDTTQFAHDEELWKQWMSQISNCRKDEKNLIELTNMKGMYDWFRARASVILLVPTLKHSPFQWNGKSNLNQNYLSNVFSDKGLDFGTFSAPLLEFVREFLIMTIDEVRLMKNDKRLYETLTSYNHLILKLLAILPENDARTEELFDRYTLNDPVEFNQMDDASGYNPFNALLCAPIPEKHKREANWRMQLIIQSEQDKKSVPRCEWEDALECYVRIVHSNLYGEIPYGRELFVIQFSFLIQLPKTRTVRIQSWKLERILKVIPLQYKDLRRRISEYALSADSSGQNEFRIHTLDQLDTARAILVEFGREYENMNCKLESMIVEAENKFETMESHPVANAATSGSK